MKGDNKMYIYIHKWYVYKSTNLIVNWCILYVEWFNEY